MTIISAIILFLSVLFTFAAMADILIKAIEFNKHQEHTPLKYVITASLLWTLFYLINKL